jgi:site-specific DNA-methyltransferase (adenine-specific)
MRVERVGLATLYLGDCREVVPSLSGIGAILADPPYGMKYRSRHNDSRANSSPEMMRKDGNFDPIEGDDEPFDPSFLLDLEVPAILWGANHYNDKLPPNRRWLIWNKLAGKASFPSGSDVEMAWTSGTGPDRMFEHLWRGLMRAGSENISANGAKLHPHQKPVALMAWCLRFIPEAVTLDPFMGSGSSGVACVRNGRPFVGIELNPDYFEVALARIGEAQRHDELFQAGHR